MSEKPVFRLTATKLFRKPLIIMSILLFFTNGFMAEQTAVTEILEWPKIISNEDSISMLSGDNLTLVCRGTNVTWILYWGREPLFFTYNVKDSEHESILELTSITFRFVRYYYCVKKAHRDMPEEEVQTLVRENKADKVYLFVNDPNQLFVDVIDSYIVGKPNETITIPCKPTSSKAEVQLIKHADNENQRRKLITGNFNIHDGFQLNSISDSDGGYYDCSVNGIIWRTFKVTVNEISTDEDNFDDVQITPSNEDILVAPGENRTIKCEGYDAFWIFSNDFRVVQHEIVKDDSQNITILNLLNIDHTYVGYYYCVEPKRQNKSAYDLETVPMPHKGIDKIYIFVNDSNQPVVSYDNPLVMEFRDKNVTIPCRPTWRGVEVELIKGVSANDSQKLQNVKYDIHRGFELQIKEALDEGYYNCVSNNITWKTFMLSSKNTVLLWKTYTRIHKNVTSYLTVEEPLILPRQSEIAISSGGNSSLACTSMVPVKWIPFRPTRKYVKEYIYYDKIDGIFQSVLEFKEIDYKFVGYYYCVKAKYENETEIELENLFRRNQTARIYVFVNDTMNLIAQHSDRRIIAGEHSNITIPCKPTSRIATIKLLKQTNMENLIEVDAKGFDIYKGFHLNAVTRSDGGDYICSPDGKNGSLKFHVDIKSTDAEPNPNLSSIVIGVSIVLVILTIFTVFLSIRIHRQRQQLKEMREAGLENFAEGKPDSINPELPLAEQADLLPYDMKYEFPRDKLRLDKQLGSGAFGVVMKAFAKGILPHEKETTVAVKMARQMADYEVVRALISELKIMAHLGQHLNVVNLLGAITKNVAKREVMVIVEFCRFGCLQDFLVKNRENFIDQIDYDEDVIDSTILSKDKCWLSVNCVPPILDTSKNATSSYASLTCANQLKGQKCSSSSGSSSHTSSGTTSDGESRSFTTTDLVCWSFQVARGMHYLASRKVLHGDLAARNILLCDDNVVKICDFGLARSIYKYENYHKKSEGKLPLKWLAIESIQDKVFSTYSDVWSFGVLLWELFSLGKAPYPSVVDVEILFQKLQDGYRMEKPELATNSLYEIMLSCWRFDPQSRPLFDDLEKCLTKLMENEVAERYVRLNEPYFRLNLTNPRADYLSMLASPPCTVTSTSPYENIDISASSLPTASELQSNYMPMFPIKGKHASQYVNVGTQTSWTEWNNPL